MKRLLYLFLAMLLFPLATFSADYYWVGGSGNWNDVTKWRTTSGGSVMPAVVPSSSDDVYFDNNSGFTTSQSSIFVNALATCRNITFSGISVAPNLSAGSSSNSLNIYGNAVFQSGMTLSGYIYFQNTGKAKTITTNGATFNNTRIYLNETTSVTLLDDFNGGPGSYFYVQAGTFNTNNKKFSVFNFYANGTASKTVTLGSSEIVILGNSSNNTSGSFNTNSSATILNAGTSHIHFMSNLAYSGITNGLVPYNGQQFYNVTFENKDSPGAPIVNNVSSGRLTFNRVEFKGGGYILGNNTFNELILGGIGKEYTFQANTTQTVNDYFAGGANCSAWTVIKSNTTSTARISVTTGATVDLNGLFVQNIVSTGIPLVANNSTSIGTVTGWTFTDAFTANLYWVGGSGSWGDSAHWSTTSGGAGGACVPGPNTNVFFDAGSGFTSSSNAVNLDGVSICKNITFRGAAVPPIVTSLEATSSLNIYGSSVWQSGMVLDVYNIYYQDTGSNKTITSNGVVTGATGSHLYFCETGSISLSDDFATGGELVIQAGTFNTNNHKVAINDMWSFSGSNSKILNLGSSDIYLLSRTSYFNMSSSSVTLNAGTSHFHFTEAITLSRGITVIGSDPVSFYDVSFENPAATGIQISGLMATMSANLSFNKITAVGGLLIKDANIQAKEIDFSPGKVYIFPEGNTVTISDRFTIGASCAGWTTLNSGKAGTQSTLSMSSGAILDMQGVMLQDINAIGGAKFTAVDSQNNGNNSSNWTFTMSPPKVLYWVGGAGKWEDANHWALTSGGAGGACVPGAADDVFFDANSGFLSTSNTVTVSGAAYCHNITVSGSTVAPTITSEAVMTNILNIYGSSVWQSGMTMSVNTINYQNTGEAKTITSNGVFSGRSDAGGGVNPTWVNIYETKQITLTDDFKATSLAVYAGTFNTGNHNITLNANFTAADDMNKKTLNFGSSEISFVSYKPTFDISSSTVTLNAGTSHIHFNTSGSSMTTLKGYPGQVFNNLTMGNSTTTSTNFLITSTSSSGTGLTFNKVVFYGGGTVEGNNIFNKLELYSSIRYIFEENKTQTIKNNLVMGGTPCNVVEILSSGNTGGIRANLNVLTGATDFNFIDMKSINASGLPLHFGSKSSIAGQNNNNVTYDPYESGAIEGLGPDKLCQVFDNNDPNSYTLSTTGFYGNTFTQFSWKKKGSNTVIGTGTTLDIRSFGYGTYTVDVTYSNGVSAICRVSDEIVVKMTPSLVVISPMEVCTAGASTTIANIDTLTGTDIKWYATSTSITSLPPTTPLVDGTTYYLTQTIDGCESTPIELKIKLISCNNKVYINPNIRLKVSY